MTLSPREINYYAQKIIEADRNIYIAHPYYTLTLNAQQHIIIECQHRCMITVPTPHLHDIHAIMRACHTKQSYALICQIGQYFPLPTIHICIHDNAPHHVTINQPEYRNSPYHRLNMQPVHHNIDDQTTLADIIHHTDARIRAHLAFMHEDQRITYNTNNIVCRNETMQHYPHIYAECKILHNRNSKNIYTHVGLRVNDKYIDIIAFPITSLHATHMWQENIPKIFPLILRNIEQYVPNVSAHERTAFLRQMQHYLNNTQHPMMQRLTRAVANMETYYISPSPKSHQHIAT